jgi:hypothetical protein
MVSWFIMSESTFTIPYTATHVNRLAQVLYANNPYSYMQLSGNTFDCQSNFDKNVIMFYDQSETDGRPGLFRLSNEYAEVERLPQLELNNTRENGTIFWT